MPSDLTVTSITTPTDIFSPCLNNRIDVEIINVGNQPAPLPIPVCLQVTANPDAPFVTEHMAFIRGLEGSALPPGGKATISFNAAIPCAATVSIKAVADCGHSVPNNAHTNPGNSIVITPTPVAWLESDLRVGIQAPNGAITWNPSVLCPGSPLVIEARVTNKGCANAPAFMTELRISDEQGMQTLSAPFNTGLLAGTSITRQFNAIVANSGTFPGQNWSMVFDFWADIGGVVLPQCDSLGLCKTIAVGVIATSGAPFVTFTVDKPVHPGEEPSITWKVQNSCADLGSLTARVKLSGTVIFTGSAIPVGVQASGGESGKIIQRTSIPPNIADALWKIGDHQLDLELASSVAGPLALTASAMMRVVPENVSRFWWSWGTVGRIASWKRTYEVDGTLTNKGQFAKMTPTSVTFTETPETPPGTPRIFPADSPLMEKEPTAPLIVSVSGLFKNWTWTAGPDWTISGSLSRTFVYTATFTLEDEFGNPYPAQAPTAILRMTVAVQASKTALARQANGFALLAIPLTFIGGGSCRPCRPSSRVYFSCG
jgi:hypothetical protein